MIEQNPYSPPQAKIEFTHSNRRLATRTAKFGAWMQFLPIVGIIVGMMGLRGATASWGDTMTEEELVKSISAASAAFNVAFFGFLGGLVGFVLLCVAVFGQTKQPRWVLAIFSVSSVFVLAMMLLLLSRK